MDTAERYTIPFKGLKSGVYDFEFPIDGALFRSFESPDIKDGDCCAKVRMERTEKQLACDVVISGEVVVPCDRCLEDCRLPVHFEGRLLVRISDETGEYDGEVMYLLPVEETLDLTQYLYESIVLSLPYQRVHPEGGCDPEMLKRFRIVSNEEFAAIEQQAAHVTEQLGDEQKETLASFKREFLTESDEEVKKS